MISKLHSFIKRAFFKTHTKCCHSWDSFTSSQHHTSPFVHSFSPGRKIWRYNLFMFRLSICWSFSNVPKESPFCIEGRRALTLRFILFVVVSKTRTMISCSFNVFRCSSNLVMFLRVNFLYFLSIIFAFDYLETEVASVLAMGETPAVILGAGVLLGEKMSVVQWGGVIIALLATAALSWAEAKRSTPQVTKPVA